MQQRLQAVGEARTEYIKETPGACQTGRTVQDCDDVDRLGWELIEAVPWARTAAAGSGCYPWERSMSLRLRLGERRIPP